MKENMHGCCLFSGHWFGRGHSAALVGAESRCSCLAWPKPGRLLKKPRSAGIGRLSTLCNAICLEHLPGGKKMLSWSMCKENQSLMTRETAHLMHLCVHIPRWGYLCVHNLLFVPYCFTDPFIHYVHIAACGFT